MSTRSIVNTAPIRGDIVTQPNPTGAATDNYVVTQGGPRPPSTATAPDANTSATPFNDVVE